MNTRCGCAVGFDFDVRIKGRRNSLELLSVPDSFYANIHKVHP